MQLAVHTNPLSIRALKVTSTGWNYLNVFRNYRRGLGHECPEHCSCMSDVTILPNGVNKCKDILSSVFKQCTINQEILYYYSYILLSSCAVVWVQESTRVSKGMFLHH